MKKTLFFFGGLLAGVLASLAILYGLGSLLEAVGISLYSSETDQQRNFNIALGFAGLAGLLCGCWAKRQA